MATFSASNFQDLVSAINESNGNNEADTIELTSNIVLEGALPLINNSGAADALTIDGGSQFSISGDVGNNSNPDDNVRIFFLQDGALNLEGLVLEEGVAQGGDSVGGGGAGMGGALFVFDGEVTISNTTFSNNQAIGGDGSIAFNIDEFDDTQKGGGIGLGGVDGADGATQGVAGGDGEFGGDGGNGEGGASGTVASNGGNGGAGGFGGGGGGGGFGGSGPVAGNGGDGGDGGFGGGGGLGGGAGGGVGGAPGSGGDGGYGAGGASTLDGLGASGQSGFGGGPIGDGETGGDGAGLGGAIFVRSGSVTISSSEFEGNSTSSGDGQGLGGAIFAVDQTAAEYGVLFSNAQDLPTVIPTVDLNRVTFEGSSAEDADGETPEGVIAPGTSFDNNDLFGDISGLVAPPPEVSVTATDAVEGKPATFIVARDNSLGALDVVLAVDGTATSPIVEDAPDTPDTPDTPDDDSAGELDFAFGDGITVTDDGQITVAFADGQDAITLTLNTTEDTFVEPDETIELALQPGGYTISATEGTATITVLNNDFQIAEDILQDASVGTVPTTLEGALTYTIASGNEGDAFAVDGSTGAITVAAAEAIDADTQAAFTLLVDVSNEAETVTETVSIAVENLPEPPSLEDQTFAIAEDTEDPVVGTVEAPDDDGDTVTFAITGGNVPIGDGGGELFAINPTTGELTIADLTEIDFETTPSYALTVTATDDSEGMLSSTATITVDVTDVNEAPEVEDQAFDLPENALAGADVGIVAAVDQENTPLTFVIESGNESGFFALDSATGAITLTEVATLDAEGDQTAFPLVVTVTDSDPEASQTTTANITINITDVPEDPVVEDQTFTIDENSTDPFVGTVIGTDEDAGETVSFAIAPGGASDLFAIDAATGDITVVDPTQIDFETQPQFALTVVGTDSSALALTDTAVITIDVNDVNDIPTIEPQSFFVDENSPAGTPVREGAVVATDQDGTISNYAITLGNDAGFFTINPTTGLISVADGATLNAEVEPTTIVLTVEVTDDNTETPGVNSAEVTIEIENVPEAPVIEDQTFTIAENPESAFVGNVPSIDEDEGDSVSYAITAGNEDGLFAIDNNGNIIITDTAQIDFETTPQFELIVTATDSGNLSDTATVTIDVTDANELPTLTVENIISALPEDVVTAVPIEIADIEVTDDALGDNSLRLSGDDATLFEIIDDGLFLIAGAALDADTQPQLNVTVEVDDATIGETPDDSFDVTIEVTNVNEAPIIEDQSFAPVPENAPDGQFIGTIVATDPEDDALTFEILEGAPADTFSIDSNGALFVANSALLDFETQPQFSLTVIVNDPSGLDDTATITFDLTDANEAPVLENTSFDVSENRQGGPVGTLEAMDPDAGDTLTYTIISGNDENNFVLDTATGAITIADDADLDFEGGNSPFSLEVAVSDGLQSDTATVLINVTNLPELPIIDTTDLDFEIEEDADVGAIVGTVIATDPEGLPLTFSLTDGNDDGFFAIDSSGNITLTEAAALDFEAGMQFFSLEVTVSDSGPDDPGVSATVSVEVLNANEPPIVANQGFFLLEELGVGTLTVGQVEASDPEESQGQFLQYALQGADASLFSIDNAGILRAPDPENLTADEFVLTVVVTDSAPGDNLSSSATIIIRQPEDQVPDDAVIDVVGVSDPEATIINEPNGDFTDPIPDDGPIEILGASGNNTIVGGFDDDVIDGGGGDDTIGGRRGNDTLLGGDGNDVISSGQGNNTVTGGDGNDTITTGTGDDRLDGGDGNDNIDGGEGDDLILGGDGDDVFLLGGLGDDTIYGEGGNDAIVGQDGDDLLFGGAGNDTITAGRNRDTLFGGSGDDQLEGRKGFDTLNGGTGNDTLLGGRAPDVLIGAETVVRGQGEIDTLTGDDIGDTRMDTDRFVLGDNNGVFYDDGDTSSQGLSDFARIIDYDITLDLVELSGSATDYRLASFEILGSSGVGILWEGDGSQDGELIGFLESVDVETVTLTNPAQFTFV